MNKEIIEKFLRYDPSSGQLFWIAKPNRNIPIGQRAGTLRADGYIRVLLSGQKYYAHRIAWLLSYGTAPVREVDHINGDRADNRIENLRLATRAQNVRNCRRPLCNTTGFKGVSRHEGKFQANIRCEGKLLYLGRFNSAEAAHAAYCKAASELHGEFARTA